MTLLFHSQFDDPAAWRAALHTHAPELPVRIDPDRGDPAAIRYALVWNPPAGFFTPFGNLQMVINLGAGVDQLLRRSDLPDVPVTRISDPNMARMMATYVQMAVIRHTRTIAAFQRAQREGRWHYLHPRDPAEIRVGVMGLGELGGLAAAELARHRFQVAGWSRTPKQIAGVACMAGVAALDPFLRRCDVLVCMLPLTPATAGLLDAARFAALPPGAAFVNVSRGAVVDEPALIAALQAGHIAEATLDVFATEPLPPGHPFWAMDNVLITPHLASIALPASAAAGVVANIRRVQAGQAPAHLVDPARGY